MPVRGTKSYSFEAVEEDGLNAYNYTEKLKKRLDRIGVGVMARPKLEKDHQGIFPNLKAGDYFDGRMPTVLRNLSLDQLSALHSLYSNWFAYLINITMLEAAKKSETARQMEFFSALLRTYYTKELTKKSAKKPTIQQIKDAATIDKRFLDACSKYEEAKALYSILDAMCKAADRDMKVISREVTIQQEKMRQDNYGTGFKNRGDWGEENYPLPKAVRDEYEE